MADVIGFAIFLVVLDLIPWSKVFDFFKGEVAPTTSLTTTLVGRWQVENGPMKGGTVLFAQSGATAWVIPTDIFGMTDCTISGVYKVISFRGGEGKPAGTYIHSTFSDKSGNCKSNFEGLPAGYDDKIDVVDADHLLLDTASLVRSN